MSEASHIPMFPLAILPLPGELVPLHIFETRYKQLLQDAENRDIHFGIYFSHSINTQRIGSLMKLESVIKRYPAGESDIIVKCQDIFSMETLLRNYKTKKYPGGEVHFWNIVQDTFAAQATYEAFIEYLKLRNISKHISPFNIYQMATELGLDVNDRYKFLLASDEKRESFLIKQVKFQTYLLQQEDKSKDVYHLN
jgi:hypothetical protein